MAMELSVIVVCFFLLLAQGGEAQAAIFDVTKYGAKPGGDSDISQALLSAWKEACAATSASTVVIPGGTFLLNEVQIAGPCKTPIELQVQGTLKAPADPTIFKSRTWVTIEYVDRLTISGTGTFDGQGGIAWSKNDCGKNPKCGPFPMNLSFNFITNSLLRDVTSLDSKNFHVNVLGCKNFTFQHFTITAPETSINTDGIHVGHSSGVNITDCNIKTGDDCISVADGTEQLNIERVNCGPGHGISVGSLGKTPNEEPVVGVTVRNCTLTGTQNGVRVKTWPASPMASTVSGLHFEDIIMNNVGFPVIIDQEYCPYNQCSKQAPSLVKISDVSFKNIRGTSSSQVTVKLLCSRSTTCQNVEIGDIDLTYNGKDGPATAECANVHATFSGKQNPPVCAKPSVSA